MPQVDKPWELSEAEQVAILEQPIDPEEEEEGDEDAEEDATTLGFDDERDDEERADGYGIDPDTGVVPCECACWPCRHNNPRGGDDTADN